MREAPRLEQTWRWYGPNDPVTLADIKQAGATGIVTALHQIPVGEVWPVEAIAERRDMIVAAGMRWSVVESIPVHEEIKSGGARRDTYIANYKQSITNLGACGVTKLCYNFMPVIDWTRTDLERAWPDGSKALAFDFLDFAAFELHILCRPGAEADYDGAQRAEAARRFEAMDDAARLRLQHNIIAGLPGKMVEAYTLAAFQKALDAYGKIGPAELRGNLAYFLRAVVPSAAAAKVLMAIHPDDPPQPLLGLPRVVSTADDVQAPPHDRMRLALAPQRALLCPACAALLYCAALRCAQALLDAVDDTHNGITFCVGSYGSNQQNNVEAMAERFAKRTHFLHFRNVIKDGPSFVESDHLDGDVDMFSIMSTFLKERARRVAEGWEDADLPFRPDHGHQMIDDLNGKKTNPGYTCIGRLRGLAELRGLEEGIVRSQQAA